MSTVFLTRRFVSSVADHLPFGVGVVWVAVSGQKVCFSTVCRGRCPHRPAVYRGHHPYIVRGDVGIAPYKMYEQAYKMVPSKYDECYGGIAAEIGG